MTRGILGHFASARSHASAALVGLWDSVAIKLQEVGAQAERDVWVPRKLWRRQEQDN